MNKTIVTIVLLCGAGAGGAGAQQAPAQRYMDAQGVEIIQNRGAPRPAMPEPARGGSVRTAPAAPAALAVADPRLQVSAAEQSERDLDREAILREELGAETRKFEAATKALVRAEQAARGQPEVGAVLKQLEAVLHSHQQNIESITAELQRTRAAR